ncbi:hypothetical protein SESBI_07833 [Sesbania bispinosa]|nr:hypothetical protein SESBI_07833 [Sesbania bispinosa]
METWQKSGSCPKGTVPIRRILKEDLLRAASLDRFGRKPAERLMNSTNFDSPKSIGIDLVVLDRTAALLMATGSNYIGAEADINVWNPKVELPDDFTTAQIWAKARNGIDFESIEAGWVVNPKLYGDTTTRLFAYWTKDSYRSTGCFDLTCSGFVQTGTQIALGAPVRSVSSESGQQYIFDAGIFLDESGNWWLKILHNVPIGYWPAELFDSLKYRATVVEWGGQVFSSKVKSNSPHTGTGMGSGDFANGTAGHSCFMLNVRVMDYSMQLKYPENVTAATEEPNCYSVLNNVGQGTDPVFYFGGPGRRPPYCP